MSFILIVMEAGLMNMGTTITKMQNLENLLPRANHTRMMKMAAQREVQTLISSKNNLGDQGMLRICQKRRLIC